MTMDCRKFTNDVMLDHSERLLDPQSRQDADNHLSACRACRDRYEEVKKVAGAVRQTLEAPAHKALMEQLEAGVLGQFARFQAGKRRSGSRHRIYWAAAVGVAAAVLVAVIIGITWKDQANVQPGQPNSNIVRKEPLPPPPPEPPTPPPPKAAPVTPVPPVTPAPEAPNPEPEPPRPAPPPPEVVRPPAPVVPEPRPTRPEPVLAPGEPSFAKGDFNRNRRLDLQDAAFLDQEILAGRVYDLAVADVTGDGQVDCGDVLAIIQAAEKNP